MRAGRLLSLAAGLTLAGCGTTVPLAQQGSGTGGDGLTLSPSATGSSVQPGGASGLPGGSGTGGGPLGSGGSSGTTTAGATATSGGAATGGLGSPGGDARGVTATTVTIGVSYAANAAAANAAIGGSGITTGDEKTEAHAVIDDLNAHGGLLGRKVVPLFYVRDAQSASSSSSQAQAECTFYTQDHSVFAVLQGNGPIDWQTKPCLQRKGVVAITAHIASLDDDGTVRTPHVDVTGMSIGRMAKAVLVAARNQSWLSPWNTATGAKGVGTAKVGLLGYDLPEVHRVVTRVIVPGLRALGTSLVSTSTIYIRVPQSTSDTASSAAAVQASVLRMRSDGITHVLFIDQGGALTLLYANEANSQSYYPRYGGSSSNGFQALLGAGDIPAKVLQGAVGAGWEPVLDIPSSPAQSAVMGGPAKACLALLRKAGASFSDPNAEALGLGYCDKVSLLSHVVRSAGALTVGAFASALDRLGDLSTARGVGSHFAAGQHDGASAFYDLVFDGGCSCMAYSGGKQHLA